MAHKVVDAAGRIIELDDDDEIVPDRCSVRTSLMFMDATQQAHGGHCVESSASSVMGATLHRQTIPRMCRTSVKRNPDAARKCARKELRCSARRIEC